MSTALLAVVVLVNIVFMVAIAVIYYKVKRIATDFITPDAETQRSGLDNLISNVADNISHSVLEKAKMQFMARQSADVRGHNAVEGDIAEGVASQHPLLATAMNLFPALRKTLRRNPDLAGYAAQKVADIAARQMGHITSPQPGDNGHHSPVELEI